MAWSRPLAEEAAATSDVLLDTLEPYQREIEQHFALEGQRRFRGLMATYLHLFTRVKYVGSSLRDRIPLLPRPRSSVQTAPTWDLATFTRACSEVAANRQLDARGKALANRLLVDADAQGYPLSVLTEPVEELGKIDWRQRYAQTLNEVLGQVEKQWSRPTGVRRYVQGTIVFLADWVPLLALLSALVFLLWRIFDVSGKGDYHFQWSDIMLPVVVVLAVLVILHLLIALLLPLRWPAIRGEFRRQLEQRLESELENAYGPLPAELAERLKRERRQIEKLTGQTHEVASWLQQREQSASIAALYGNSLV